jgi:hypothetical protein
VAREPACGVGAGQRGAPASLTVVDAAGDPPRYLYVVQGAGCETGAWCSACLLPSAVRVPLYAMGDVLEAAFRVGSAVTCGECGAVWAE